jgi:hypothetical protein
MTIDVQVKPTDREEVTQYARGRRLLIDSLEGTFGCGGIAAGDVYLRWQDAPRSAPGVDFLPATGLEPVSAFVRSDIAGLLSDGVFRIEVRGRGPFRRPVLILVKPRAWLEYLGNVPGSAG